MDNLTKISLLISLTGLSVLYFYPSSQYKYRTIEEVKEKCEGKVKVQGRIIKTFKSEQNNLIGLMSGNKDEEVLLLLEEHHRPSEELTVKGKASKYREQCFLFPDKIEKT